LFFQVFEEMKRAGVPSDTITFNALILACEKGGKSVSPRSSLRVRQIEEQCMPPEDLSSQEVDDDL